jgi:hypothetical protein
MTSLWEREKWSRSIRNRIKNEKLFLKKYIKKVNFGIIIKFLWNFGVTKTFWGVSRKNQKNLTKKWYTRKIIFKKAKINGYIL